MASPTPSEIRSQAVAKLKRAASLPRTPRRPQEDSEEMLAPSPQPSSTYTPTRDELSPGMLTASHSLSPSPTPERYQGRSTPSPLPTLGELRMLSRSNSTAARANALKKLMGDASAPDEIVRPMLQRADSLGSKTPEPVRLARSHTVGGGGEERRSAVGRRMMARLGNRTPTEVPMLGRQLSISDLTQPVVTVDQPPVDQPEEVLNSPTELSPPEEPQRSVSRGTEFSTGTGEEAFEYEHHLRRSMSNRTARAEVDSVRGSVDKERAEPVIEVDEDLPLPKPAFHSHTPHGSTSTVTDGESVLGQMMFTTDSGVTGGNFPVGVDESPGRDWHPSQASSSRVSKSSEQMDTSSTMSWEEIPQPEKKSDSIISKLERSLRGTLRKRSSAGSEATSPRRGSENSSLGRKDSQPSIHRKLSYTSTPYDSRAGSFVASGKSSPLPLPAADGQDLRYLDAKLSPFPGMAQLEDERRRKGEPPRLIHQSSDPVVPTRPPLAAGDSLFSLPGQYIDLQSDLAESSSRQGWLAKTLQHRKRPSASERKEEPITPPMANDPFAGGPMRSPASPRQQRSASPTVSVVHETDEGRWRQSEKPIPSKSVEVLERLDAVLRLSGDDPARPTMLDDPPRKLLLCCQVLQVVNNYTVKDRYLFLFTDILVIAKPLLVSNEPATLDMKFVVKSVVSLDKLAVTGISDETSDNRTHPVVQSFITQFSQDPIAAVNYLVERSNPKVDAATLASLLFKTPELDRGQIGLFLSMPEQKHTLRAFIDRFHFTGVRIDDALRMFLLALRLPTEANASEILLQSFTQRWYEANHSSIAFDRSLALDLVLAIMQLNDALNPTAGFGFAFPNQAITAEDFISAFRAKDTRGAVHDDNLYDIYDSIREDMLVQALPNSRDERPVTVTPTSPKLTYNEWSDPITIRIPHADPEFGIRLHGQGLEFEPSALDFTTTATQTFRVKGTALGAKSLLFDRVGLHAPFYAAVGNTRTFTIERAFMAHTFQLAFVNHLGVKRKYCFSVDDAETRRRWGQVLSSQIKRSEGKRLRAAETVALQVLRDALIGKEDARRGRSNSVSAAFSHELGSTTHVSSDKDSGLLDIQTGKELVLLCRQNSLLPLVLSFLQSGVNVV